MSSAMTDRPPAATSYTTGYDGEIWVAEWLLAQGAKLIAQRWRCRSGELDLVMKLPIGCPRAYAPVKPGSAPWTLVFIEVKTRKSGNWDANGLLAIDLRAQQRLTQAAAAFLAQHPDLAELPCRFDVALVRRSGSQLSLQSYLWNAIEA